MSTLADNILRLLSVRDSKLTLEADDQLATLLCDNAAKIAALLTAAEGMAEGIESDTRLAKSSLAAYRLAKANATKS